MLTARPLRRRQTYVTMGPQGRGHRPWGCCVGNASETQANVHPGRCERDRQLCPWLGSSLPVKQAVQDGASPLCSCHLDRRPKCSLQRYRDMWHFLEVPRLPSCPYIFKITVVLCWAHLCGCSAWNVSVLPEIVSTERAPPPRSPGSASLHCMSSSLDTSVGRFIFLTWAFSWRLGSGFHFVHLAPALWFCKVDGQWIAVDQINGWK